MFSIHIRDGLEKLKMQETKSLLCQEGLKGKLGSKNFITIWKKFLNALLQSRLKLLKTRIKTNSKFNNKQKNKYIEKMSQNLSENVQQSSNNINKNLHHSIKQGTQEFDEIKNRKNQALTNLVNSNTVDSSIVKAVSNLLNNQVNLNENLMKEIYSQLNPLFLNKY